MQVALSTFRIDILTEEGFTIAFTGMDLVRARFGYSTGQPGTHTSPHWSVFLELSFREEPFEIPLKLVRNQPHWTNDEAGARAAVIDIGPIIRAAPSTSGLSSAKRSVEYDSGSLQLVGDVDAPGNNKVWGTDSGGNRTWKDDPVGGLVDAINAGSNPDVQLIESLNAGVLELKRIKRDGLGTRAQANTGSAQVNIHFSAQDRIHYSDGLGDPLETPITALGRQLIDDATQADMRTTLGLGALATATPGTGVATALAQNADSASGFVTQSGGDTRWLTKQVTGLTITAASWSLVSGLYEADLSNANILATSIVEMIPDNADIAIVQAAQVLPRTDSSAGSVKCHAQNLPSGDIGVTINIFTT